LVCPGKPGIRVQRVKFPACPDMVLVGHFPLSETEKLVLTDNTGYFNSLRKKLMVPLGSVPRGLSNGKVSNEYRYISIWQFLCPKNDKDKIDGATIPVW
jgi:hypothetical protein